MSAMTYTVELAPRAARPRSASSSLRLTARGRALLVVVALLGAVLWTLQGPGAHAGSAEPAVAVTAMTVAPGQTLWQIAATITAPDQDIRDVVDRLIALNELDGASLQAGQQILVPQD